MTEPDLDKLFGPKLVYEEAGLIDDQPLCYRCGGNAEYVLDKLLLELRTSEGGLTVVESRPSHTRIAVCGPHKDDDLEEYIAGGCHLAIMQQSNVVSDLEAYTLYWQEL